MSPAAPASVLLMMEEMAGRKEERERDTRGLCTCTSRESISSCDHDSIIRIFRLAAAEKKEKDHG